jgi:predicted transcriptional regulator
MRSPRPETRLQAAAREKRKVAYNLRAQNHTYEDIAAGMGITENMARMYVQQATRKDGFPELDVKISGALKQDPQAVGNVLAAAIVANAADDSRNEQDKYRALTEACRENGLPPKIVAALLKRLRTSLAPVMDEGKKLAVSEFTGELEKKISKVFEYIDDFSMANASFKDLSIGLSTMIEKHQLLSNKPTMILDVTARMALPDLMREFAAEAQRRGVTVDSTAVRVDGPG